MLSHPGEQSCQHPLRRAAIVVPGGDTFLDFVDPKHAGRHHLRQLKRFADVLLGFTEKFVTQGAEVEAQQGHMPDAGYRLCRQGFAAALYAYQQNSLGSV